MEIHMKTETETTVISVNEIEIHFKTEITLETPPVCSHQCCKQTGVSVMINLPLIDTNNDMDVAIPTGIITLPTNNFLIRQDRAAVAVAPLIVRQVSFSWLINVHKLCSQSTSILNIGGLLTYDDTPRPQGWCGHSR
jgi:hypothetical protein